MGTSIVRTCGHEPSPHGTGSPSGPESQQNPTAIQKGERRSISSSNEVIARANDAMVCGDFSLSRSGFVREAGGVILLRVAKTDDERDAAERLRSATPYTGDRANLLTLADMP